MQKERDVQTYQIFQKSLLISTEAIFAKEYFLVCLRQYETKLIFGTLFHGFFLVIHIPSDMGDSGSNIASLDRQRRKELKALFLKVPSHQFRSA
jgi:hypothetical protein